MKRIFLKVCGVILLPILLLVNSGIRWLARILHKIQFFVQWGGTSPRWFDHFLDLYYFWGEPSGNVFLIERGHFSLLAIEREANVLELCCGEGFNSKYFYSYRAAHVLSCDFDSTAIDHAKRYNQTRKNEFVLADIRNGMPEGKFDNVIWDASIEQFTMEEVNGIMQNIKNRLRENGVLSGSAIVKRTDGRKSLSHNKYEFESKEALLCFLSHWFTNVKVIETIYPERHNLYFYASEGIIPFSANWEYMVDKYNEGIEI